MELKHAEITGPLIDVFFLVYKTLGFGFLERVYMNSMIVAGKKFGLEIRKKYPIRVSFEGVVVGNYEADLLVNKAVIAELKTVRTLTPQHEAQLLNYLKATEYEVGFLFNFGPKAEYKRMIFENSRKGSLSWTKTADGRRLALTNTDSPILHKFNFGGSTVRV
jgi:GxxExxY protein